MKIGILGFARHNSIQLLRKVNPKSTQKKQLSSSSLHQRTPDSRLLVQDSKMNSQSVDTEIQPKDDPNTRPRTLTDPGWKYAFCPNINIRDLVEYSLCARQMIGGIKLIKQHHAGDKTNGASNANQPRNVPRVARGDLTYTRHRNRDDDASSSKM
ncbi:hypothetical protein POM88_024968 [Heracleum sosnowskyi]|uniref:Uncharacterized protein n=1 Tax=Heracleum sosnowskyi TaxID=360622 RepID=A0AAD8I4E0_9APIA|nr:hypothetical protein POM88_024968 [Heracleum sosnowskyi]